MEVRAEDFALRVLQAEVAADLWAAVLWAVEDLRVADTDLHHLLHHAERLLRRDTAEDTEHRRHLPEAVTDAAGEAA